MWSVCYVLCLLLHNGPNGDVAKIGWKFKCCRAWTATAILRIIYKAFKRTILYLFKVLVAPAQNLLNKFFNWNVTHCLLQFMYRYLVLPMPMYRVKKMIQLRRTGTPRSTQRWEVGRRNRSYRRDCEVFGSFVIAHCSTMDTTSTTRIVYSRCVRYILCSFAHYIPQQVNLCK